jgi:hypothetical protein
MRSRTPFPSAALGPPACGRPAWRRLPRRLAPLLASALLAAALGCGEDAQSPTAPEPGPGLDITPAQVLSFRQVSAGFNHTCGVTPDNRAYCWGYNFFGQLGDGTTTTRLAPVAVAAPAR